MDVLPGAARNTPLPVRSSPRSVARRGIASGSLPFPATPPCCRICQQNSGLVRALKCATAHPISTRLRIGARSRPASVIDAPLRRIYGRRLFRTYPGCRFERVTSAEALETGMNALAELHQARWQAKGEPGAFSPPLPSVSPGGDARCVRSASRLALWTLEIQGRIEGALVGFVDNGVVYFSRKASIRRLPVPPWDRTVGAVPARLFRGSGDT